MPERKYSVSEIDRMRTAVEHQWLFGWRISEPDPVQIESVSEDGSVTLIYGSGSRAHTETEKTKCVEEMLRTYMIAGVEPEELE